MRCSWLVAGTDMQSASALQQLVLLLLVLLLVFLLLLVMRLPRLLLPLLPPTLRQHRRYASYMRASVRQGERTRVA